MAFPEPGDRAPAFDLLDQNEERHALGDYAGRPLFVYFYPKASTPGCTQQACHLRDIAGDIGDAAVVGISPDSPKRLANFAAKNDLGFTLLSDPDHAIAEAYGVWAEKKNYGKTYMGIVRSGLLIDAKGVVTHAWPKLSPKDTPGELLAALSP